ncbi:pro-sigmaK processing inhibitor BofA family protein [Paenibacillus dakarensis]|uniref:pro-sigmaK processing inhibitor BofA family protein n=1 Tax=Paenibacillus dakarensis TaxID=1527293 RepID=UPI0006D5B41E|nr:pro-sigmaK processing inhibitor BofA family protein [Paenibacillus dakarensis]
MKLIVAGVLCVSLLLLILVVFKKKLGLGWLTLFGSHLALSAIAIYIFNFSGFIDETYIPLNPMTIGTVMVLGLPGVALLLGLKLTLI